MLILLFSRMTETTCISPGTFQLPYFFPHCFFKFLDNHLCYTVTVMYDLFFIGEVD